MARTFAVLDLFTADRMVWTADAIAERLDYTRPTAYRYIKELVSTGMLVRFGDGAYSLGPRIVELDFLIRQADPLLVAGLPVIQQLVARTGYDVNLAGLYGDRVVTIHQERGTELLPLSFGRGRPLPLLRGAGSKIIAAHLPRPHLKRAYDKNHDDAARCGLGESWPQFLTAMARFRHAGYATSEGELDSGFAGVAVPVFSPDRRILGCIVAALTQQRMALTNLERLVDLLKDGAATMADTLAKLDRATAADKAQNASDDEPSTPKPTARPTRSNRSS